MYEENICSNIIIIKIYYIAIKYTYHVRPWSSNGQLQTLVTCGVVMVITSLPLVVGSSDFIAVQSQKAVTAYFSSKQLLLFGVARRYRYV